MLLSRSVHLDLDIKTVVAVVVLLCLGGIYGAWMGRWSVTGEPVSREPVSREPVSREPDFVCPCGHHYLFHADNGVCHGNRNEPGMVSCGCQVYFGDPPFDERVLHDSGPP